VTCLERGRTRVIVRWGDAVDEQVVGSHPADVAMALRRYGLGADVTSVQIEADTLETVIFGLIAAEGKKDKEDAA